MFYRSYAVLFVTAGLLASAGFAAADNTALKPPALTLDPVSADSMPPSGPLMMGLDKLGLGAPLNKLNLNIYGWVEAGYTYDNRHDKTVYPILPGPFNHEWGGTNFWTIFVAGGDRNHFMLNQVALRFERLIKNDQWDLGGLIELQYGTDADAIHANGFALGNDTYEGLGGTDIFRAGNDISNVGNRFNPQYQLDITQAYIDVNLPLGNGLVIRTGKFVSLMGYETIDPRGNPFYSHSYLFSVMPFTFTGILGMYKINDQWQVKAGISRGWDQSLEDNNAAIDALGQVIFTPNKQWHAALSWTCGPENDRDSSHYRTALDAIVVWQATDKLKLGFEAYYAADGGWNENGTRAQFINFSHAYGDQWGGALYGQYILNDYCTFNLRLEKFHTYVANVFDGNLFNNIAPLLGIVPNQPIPTENFYSITAGVTLKPFPHDPLGKNLIFRPEVRYTYADGPKPFFEGSNTSIHAFKDQLLFACDIVFAF